MERALISLFGLAVFGLTLMRPDITFYYISETIAGTWRVAQMFGYLGLIVGAGIMVVLAAGMLLDRPRH